MRKLVTSLLGSTLLMCLAVASQGAAKYPPGPPYRACTDTLTIYDVQATPDSTISPCAPARLDTVLGIRGIVTGFDAKTPGFAIFFQNSKGGAYSGVQAFTGSFNYNGPVAGTPTGGNLALGDSIVVYGTMQEFPNPNGTTEIEGPDTVQGTNDILIRKISSGNPLPKFQILTTTQMNFIPTLPTSEGEKWEETLVKIRGPLVVKRIGPPSGTGAGLFNNSFLVTKSTSPTDSVMIDGSTLATYASPTVGTVIDSVQGIANQGTAGGVNSFRVQIRDGNDLFLSVPPNLVDAYPIEDNIIRLTFDRNVDPTSSQNAANYSLASAIDGSTVDSAVLEGGVGTHVQLHITTVRVDGDAETVTAQNIASATCGGCVMSSQSRSFVQGVLTVAEVQTPDASVLPTFDDRSRWAGLGTLPGTKLTFRGICTGEYAPSYTVEDADGGLRGGILVFAPISPMVKGHKYLFAGQVQEFSHETEAVSNVYSVDEGVGTLPAPKLGNISVLKDTTVDQGGSALNPTGNILNGEDYEGMLVKLDHVTNRSATMNPGTGVGGPYFLVTGYAAMAAGGAGPDSTIRVQNFNAVLDAYTLAPLNTVLDITGYCHFDDRDNTWRICPRTPSDIVSYGVLAVGPQTGSLMFAVGPNPARTVKLAFAVPERRNVDIGVYDVVGRRVATVAKGTFEAGPHNLTWDGTDNSGQRVRAGLYFYRAQLGKDVMTGRNVMLQ
jgi:hypothetical protein